MIKYRLTWVCGFMIGIEWAGNMVNIAFGIFDLLIVWGDDELPD